MVDKRRRITHGKMLIVLGPIGYWVLRLTITVVYTFGFVSVSDPTYPPTYIVACKYACTFIYIQTNTQTGAHEHASKYNSLHIHMPTLTKSDCSSAILPAADSGAYYPIFGGMSKVHSAMNMKCTGCIDQ